MKTSSIFAGLIASSTLLFFSEKPLHAGPEFSLNFGTVAPDGTPWSAQLQGIKDRIEKDSSGRVQVKLFLGGSLGSEIEMIQDVQKGERLQGGGFSTGAVGEALDIAVLKMVELPFLFRSNEEADKVLDTVLLEPTRTALSEKGIQFYAWSENGWRNFATQGPASSPTELTQYKMRSQESDVHLNMYRSMGVQAVAKPVSEVVPSLNTGIVTGFDNTPLFSLAAGWIQPVTHYTLSRHIYQPAAVFYSKNFIERLPSDLQDIMMANSNEESLNGRASVRAMENELIQTIDGMGKTVTELSPEQRKAFVKACRSSTHTAFLASNPDMKSTYETVKVTLKSMR
jgi:TRAP-type transport system periplasmic protein